MKSMQQGNTELIQTIRAAIHAAPQQAISFRDYMDLCLYHPMHGYYMNGKEKIGKEGDFYTSSSIGSLLGETLADWIRNQSFWTEGETAIYLTEWGGGTGRLAGQMLDALELSDKEFYRRVRYISIEESPFHRQTQEETLLRHAERIQFLSAAEWVKLGPWENTLVFSNELPDAFPVHRIVFREKGWMEIHVRWNEADHVLEEIELPVNDTIQAYIHKESMPQRIGQQFEVQLAAIDWMQTVARGLKYGAVLTMDYGDQREELYASHRMNGTFLCYRKHQASDQALLYPGEQDMTSHVNFSSLIEAGEEEGLKEWQWMTQKQFLAENGLLYKLQDHDARDPFSPAAKRNRAIRQLLLSDQMSELFKVLIQIKR